MIDGSAGAPPLLLQLVLQQEIKLTVIHVVVATKEALKMKKKRMEHKEVCSLALIGGEGLFLDPTPLGSCGQFPLMESQHLEGPEGTKSLLALYV